MNRRSASFLATLFFGTTLLTGCVFAPVMPPRGILFNNQKAPLFQGSRPGSLEGRASAHSILFLVGWGDAGLAAALRDGEITEIRHTDYQALNILLVYQRLTVIVYGENDQTRGESGGPGGPPPGVGGPPPSVNGSPVDGE